MDKYEEIREMVNKYKEKSFNIAEKDNHPEDKYIYACAHFSALLKEVLSNIYDDHPNLFKEIETRIIREIKNELTQ